MHIGEIMSNIIFMTNIENQSKKDRVKPYKYSVSSWKQWANKNDCEFFILEN